MSWQGGLPEKGKCMNELTKQSGVLLLLGEDWGFCCEAVGTPEPAGCPVCERPRNAQLSNQGKDVVVLNSRTRSFPIMLCMDISSGGTMPEKVEVAAASCVHRPTCLISIWQIQSSTSSLYFTRAYGGTLTIGMTICLSVYHHDNS